MNERTWHITVAKIMAVIGFVLACTVHNTGARYFAMCVFASGVYACNSVILGWVASTCGQTKEKKAISLAMANTIATLGPIYTPVSSLDSENETSLTPASTFGQALMSPCIPSLCQAALRSQLPRLSWLGYCVGC